MERLVSRVVRRRLSQRRVAALGAGLLGVGKGAAGEPSVSGPGRVMAEVAGRNRRAGSPSQGLLLSLGVEGHVAMVMASGWMGLRDTQGGFRFKNKVWFTIVFQSFGKVFKLID